MVREHLALAPRRVELGARDGTTTVLEPESEPVFWTTPVLYLWTGAERRPVTSEDLRAIARLSSRLARSRASWAWRWPTCPPSGPRLRGPAGDRRGHAQARAGAVLLAAGHGRARPDEARLPGAVVQRRLHCARAAAVDEPGPRGLRAERRPRHPGDGERRAHGRDERAGHARRRLRRRQRRDPGRHRGEPAASSRAAPSSTTSASATSSTCAAPPRSPAARRTRSSPGPRPPSAASTACPPRRGSRPSPSSRTSRPPSRRCSALSPTCRKG